jgi:hypothetical protein
MDHESFGAGAVSRSTCRATWDLYIPHYTTRHPFYCLIARGSHAHHPPNPTRLSSELREEMEELIKSTEVINLTKRGFSICCVASQSKSSLGRFYTSPEYQRICAKYNVDSLSQIHASLTNEDQIGALIYKQKLLLYPDGLQLQGSVWI